MRVTVVCVCLCLTQYCSAELLADKSSSSVGYDTSSALLSRLNGTSSARQRDIVSGSQSGMIYYSTLTLGTSNNYSSWSGGNSGGSLLPDLSSSSQTQIITTDTTPPEDKSTENLVSTTPHTNGPANPAVPSPQSVILALIGLAFLCVKPQRKRAMAVVRVRD